MVREFLLSQYIGSYSWWYIFLFGPITTTIIISNNRGRSLVLFGIYSSSHSAVAGREFTTRQYIIIVDLGLSLSPA